jgi:hypothetical protein
MYLEEIELILRYAGLYMSDKIVDATPNSKNGFRGEEI